MTTSSPLAVMLFAILTASPASAQFSPGPYPAQTEFLKTETQARALEETEECIMIATYKTGASVNEDADELRDAIMAKKRFDQCGAGLEIGTIFVRDPSKKAATAQARTKDAIRLIFKRDMIAAPGLVHFPRRYVFVGN